MSRVPSLSSPFLLGFDENRARARSRRQRRRRLSSLQYREVDRANGQPEHLRITLAVAGFTRDQLDVTIEENQLVIRGRQQDDKARQYIHSRHRGAPLPAHLRARGGDAGAGRGLKNGLLSIDLARAEPEKIVKTMLSMEHE